MTFNFIVYKRDASKRNVIHGFRTPEQEKIYEVDNVSLTIPDIAKMLSLGYAEQQSKEGEFEFQTLLHNCIDWKENKKSADKTIHTGSIGKVDIFSIHADITKPVCVLKQGAKKLYTGTLVSCKRKAVDLLIE